MYRVDLSAGYVSRHALAVLHLRPDSGRLSPRIDIIDVRRSGRVAAVRPFPARHALRLSHLAADQPAAPHSPVRAADQPLQREDLPARLVLAAVRRRGHLRQPAALDFQAVRHVRTGIPKSKR